MSTLGTLSSTRDCHTDPAVETTDGIIDRAGHSLTTSSLAGTSYRTTFRWLANTVRR